MATLTNGQAAYLDANILIYLLEDYPEYRLALDSLLSLIETGKVQAHTSQLSLTEILVKPYKDNAHEVVEQYKALFDVPQFLTVHQVTPDILVKAAEIRSQSSIKLPDAIHIATAQLSDCHIIITSDRALKNVEQIEVIGLDDLDKK